MLIRAMEGVVGPGRVTSRLHIDGTFNGAEAYPPGGLWFEDIGLKPPPRQVTRTARIGVEYAGPVWATKKLRFLLCLGVNGVEQPGGGPPLRK